MLRSDRRTSARLGGRCRHTGLVCKAGPAIVRDPRGMAEVPATVLLPMCVSVGIWKQSGS